MAVDGEPSRMGFPLSLKGYLLVVLSVSNEVVSILGRLEKLQEKDFLTVVYVTA